MQKHADNDASCQWVKTSPRPDDYHHSCSPVSIWMQQLQYMSASHTNTITHDSALQKHCSAPCLQELVVAELCEMRAQALLVAHQEAFAAQPEQVREGDACTGKRPDGTGACDS